MSSLLVHCKVCLDLYGVDYSDAHVWLDELADHGDYIDVNHRHFRHHKQGIEEGCLELGEEFRKGLESHVREDVGFIPDESYYRNKEQKLFLKKDIFKED